MLVEGIRNFLESSTIHGLTYISVTRKYVRLFWIAIVIAGFTCAGVLICTSFQAWHDNPIKTTIETLPIRNIQFPKVTVCPPKNTYTNLNYDLMMTRNMTIDDETRKDIANYAMMLVNTPKFEELIRNMSMFHEENRYYNWYHDYSNVKLPQYIEESTHRLRLKTSAASGSVSLQNLEQIFDSKNLSIEMNVNLFLPKKDASKSDDIQLHLEIDRNKVTEGNGYESFTIGFKDQDSDTSHIIRNVTQQYPAVTPMDDVFFFYELCLQTIFEKWL